MKPPAIDKHGFSVSRKKLAASYRWNFPGVAAVPFGLMVWDTLTRDGGAPGSMLLRISAMVGLLGCLAGVLWVLYRLQWKRQRELAPTLSFGPDGIHDRRRWSRPIPWLRIKGVRPVTRDPEAYGNFRIEIEGRNDFSRSKLERLFDTWVVHAMGGRPSFTVSFRELDADAATVAALVRSLVATVEA